MRNITINRHGFTLVELLIVLAIVSVLISIIQPAYHKYLIKIRATEKTLQLNYLMKLVKHYEEEVGLGFPPTQSPGLPCSDGLSSDDQSTPTSCHKPNVWGFEVDSCDTIRFAYYYCNQPPFDTNNLNFWAVEIGTPFLCPVSMDPSICNPVGAVERSIAPGCSVLGSQDFTVLDKQGNIMRKNDAFVYCK